MNERHRLNEKPGEEKSIYLRGFVVRETPSGKGWVSPESEDVATLPPSGWTLTFDCETGIDPAQALRFGAYQLRNNGVLARKGEGLFYAEDISAADLAVLQSVAEMRGLRLMTVRQFADWILFDRIYETGGTVIGFNLPFDISRIAFDHGPARKVFAGGFSFKLSSNPYAPRVIVKHISSRMAFIRFGNPSKRRTPESQRKLGISVAPRTGSFVDVKTLAAGLLSGGWSLETLSSALKVSNPKIETDEHGGALTPKYVGYALNDVQATWECYETLTTRLASYDLSTIEPKTLYSEASLGKAYLRQMGVRTWREMQPDFPPEMIGQILSTYFGGRAEVKIRRERRQVLYCDFLSMYPTVCTLMGLWQFVIATGMDWTDATVETQALLDRIEPADMLRPEQWSDLTALVQLRPANDILPIRAKYGDEGASTIGVNEFSSGEPRWFTLADVIAAKVLGGGKVPVIDRAIRFSPREKQSGLQPIDIAGKAKFHVEPATTDFYQRVIDLRLEVKSTPAQSADDAARLKSEQLALKILANATSYGIFIEMIVHDLEKAETLKGYGSEGVEFPVTTNKYEQPGSYFHPLLATLITGAARLMLALAERCAADEGLDWVFCDTDSLAIARPRDMDAPSFIAAARRVCVSFAGLNPYEVSAESILQIEDQNYAMGDKRKVGLDSAPPLHCFAISAKRYALFNDGSDGPIIRKASAHGLGHLLPPYQDMDKDRRAKRLADINVDLWQEDLWKRIITAAEDAEPDDAGYAIGLDTDERFGRPVASRYAATTPALLKWFKSYNRGKPYEKQVRPFGFLLSMQSEKIELRAHDDTEALARWRKHKRDPAPTAPYDRDPRLAAEHAFDRRHRDIKIPPRWLISYADALADYHLQPETKFRGGEKRGNSGPLERRHIIGTAAQMIGKEAEGWEEQLYVGEDDAAISYGLTPEARAGLVESIRIARKRFSVRKFTKAARVTDRTIAAAVSSQNLVSDATLIRLADVAVRLWQGWEAYTAEEAELCDWAWQQAIIEGMYAFAGRVGVDGSNLSKALKSRKFSTGLLIKLRAAHTSPTA
ncbi:hypothetical protein [Sphingomonas sp. Root241]|uniref:hypothetical protein n=1 Tax=Sphingomonas sp. Root241 TaxID=1736501 RepID=UPI0006F60D82|nr:hypothetical protein [Sphingomonas sp. Root241]KRC80214.1 hypothetical protein ASE13_14490 [Sphingomonas sp. Root241]